MLKVDAETAVSLYPLTPPPEFESKQLQAGISKQFKDPVRNNAAKRITQEKQYY